MEVEINADANPPLELLSVKEAARQLGASDVTLARRILARGVKPDALLILASSRKRTMLFAPGRLDELKGILPR